MDAPRGSVEFEGTDELQRLRRRAYGPDADIAGDAVAQARLSELEAAQRRQSTLVVYAAARGPAAVSERVPVSEPVEGRRSASTSVPQPVDGELAERDPAGGSVTGQYSTEGPIANSDPVDGPPAAPWWRRRRWLVILGVAIAALVLIAALLAWMSQPLADESTPMPTVTSTAKIPPVPYGFGRESTTYPHRTMFSHRSRSVTRPIAERSARHSRRSGDQPRRVDALRGLPRLRRRLDLQRLERRVSLRNDLPVVAVPVQGIREGNSADDCSPEGMDAIAELGMGGDGLTQFVFEGDHVDVYVYERAADLP